MLNPSREGAWMKDRKNRRQKDKAVKLAGQTVMDDFGIIMASQARLS
jgi:hypothetical protein